MSSMKVYPRIDRALAFGPGGAGPEIAPVTVMAIVHPSKNYPEHRITIGTRHGAVSLTPRQVDELITSLAQARSEAVQACPSLLSVKEPS